MRMGAAIGDGGYGPTVRTTGPPLALPRRRVDQRTRSLALGRRRRAGSLPSTSTGEFRQPTLASPTGPTPPGSATHPEGAAPPTRRVGPTPPRFDRRDRKGSLGARSSSPPTCGRPHRPQHAIHADPTPSLRSAPLASVIAEPVNQPCTSTTCSPTISHTYTARRPHARSKHARRLVLAVRPRQHETSPTIVTSTRSNRTAGPRQPSRTHANCCSRN
jgi:hypothetical protein